MPADPAIAGSGSLIGPGGAQLVEAFLAAEGWRVLGQRPAQAMYYPGRSLLVRHTAWAERAGEQQRFSLCTELEAGDETTPAPPPSTWAYPADPALPALARATDHAQARAWLAVERPWIRSMLITPQSYRPKRRAVLRYRLRAARTEGADVESLFVKVLTADDAERTWRLGEALRGAGLPLALPATRPEPEVLVFETLRGTPLRDLLLGRGTLPAPERLLDLMERVADLGPLLSNPAGRPAIPGLRYAARVVRRVLPEERGEVLALRDLIRERIERYPVEPRVIHGDFYEGQVMMREDYTLGLLDLDDIGIGDPALDAASCCAHLVALADSFGAAAPRLLAYRTLLREQFMRAFDVAEEGFAAREALVMLQLATGPFRVLEENWPERVRRRLRLARMLLEERAPVAAR